MDLDFNCEEFAEQACLVAQKYFSDDITDEDREFVLNCIQNSGIRTAKVLSADKTLNLNQKEILYVGYIILEWIFKIAVALVESDIPRGLRHGIILDTGFVAFNITKDLCKLSDISREKIYSTGEYHVINNLKETMEKLIAESVITEKIRDSFLNHYYINKSQKRIEFALNS